MPEVEGRFAGGGHAGVHAQEKSSINSQRKKKDTSFDTYCFQKLFNSISNLNEYTGFHVVFAKH